MYTSSLFALAASLGSVSAVYKGFNYGSTFTNNAPKVQSDFQYEFGNASALVGTSGFTSARLYTMIQAGTTNTPIEAIPAAIDTQTTLLLGLWASAGQSDFNNELAALSSAISQYGSSFASLVAGISVGSEDLYRISPTGIENMSGAGADPDVVANFISQVRSAIANTALSSVPVGHVDTWTAWVNSSNDAVINACDFIGMDAYPYYQTTMANSIDNGNATFWDAYDATQGAVSGKPVWITETGWPVSGPMENQAQASITNAQRYWDEAGCAAFGKINTWWFTLQDAAPDTPSPSFGIVGSTLSTQPIYNLTCPAGTNGASDQSSSGSSSASATGTATAVSGSGGSSAPVATNTQPGPESSPASSASASAPGVGSGSGSSAPAGSAPAPSDPAPTSSSGSSSGSGSGPGSGSGASAAPTTTIVGSSAGGAAPAPSSSSATSALPACPTDLNGPYEYPHLIVPIDSTQPDTALGTSYNGTVSSTVSSLFNFDIPSSDAGKTCSLTFLLPEASQLRTSNYEISGSGGIQLSILTTPAATSTTYSNSPAAQQVVGSVDNLQPGGAYHISSDSCPAGTTVGFEMKATGSLSLNYFQDNDLPGIGLYVTVC
ncbi:glycoside hydrolase family 17 protein [Viridothelium virens]|uniref:Probable glucan endo-1,3-beta-glucosidase eglC n=1 Tax=Viridothelium virens TaxID=1048519 RepID=A0A6A6HFX3_VIRVR|nr:glycoside hydrolase family 17 protein [Viridothelium virens]